MADRHSVDEYLETIYFLAFPIGEYTPARRVLPDRKGEEVDRLQVLVDGVAVGHLWLYCRREPL